MKHGQCASFSVTVTELEALHMKANAKGVTLSDLIREGVGLPARNHHVYALTEAEKKMILEMRVRSAIAEPGP